MATHFNSDKDGRRYGPGPLAVAALVGAVFGGLAVALVVSRTGAIAEGAPGDLWPWVVAATLLFAFALGSNLWARAEAHRRHRRLARKIAAGQVVSERAISRVDELLAKNGD